MRGDVGAFEATDVLLALADALFAARGFTEHLKKGMGKSLLIVGIYIETGGTSGFFEAAASAGNYGEAALDGFDDRNAKAFVTGGIDKGLGHLIEGGEIGIGNSLKEMKTGVNSEATGFGKDSTGIGFLTAYDNKMDIGGQKGKGLDGKEDVLALFDGADMDDVAGGKKIAGIDFLTLVFADGLVEPSATGLIDEADLLFGHVAVMDDVATGTLGDGDDEVGLADSAAELPGVDVGVDPGVIFGMTEEDEVVDGDDGADAAAADAQGKFTGEAMIELDTIANEVADNAEGTPKKQRVKSEE